MRRAGADERGPRRARRGGVGSEQPARLTRRRAARGACSVPCGARPRSALPGRRLLYCPTRRCRARADERRCANNWRYRRASDHNAAVRCPRSHIYTSLKQYTLARYHILSHLSFVKKLSSQDSWQECTLITVRVMRAGRPRMPYWGDQPSAQDPFPRLSNASCGVVSVRTGCTSVPYMYF